MAVRRRKNADIKIEKMEHAEKRPKAPPLAKGCKEIVWLTSEAAPYAKTGGLADVSQALPLALSRKGHRVSVIMPYYPQIMGEHNRNVKVSYELLGVPFLNRMEWAQILEHRISPNLTYYFIEYHSFFNRPALYDWQGIEYGDNSERFIFFCRACMQAILALKLKPDILHTNDWHTALCSVYLRSPLYKHYHNFDRTASILTIHNLAYQGVYHKSHLYFTGLGWEYFNYRCLEFYDQINLLKSGILAADYLTTVSPTHAQEILSPTYGFNLDAPLRDRFKEGRLRGILNGIDVDAWNPAADKHIPAGFTAEDMAGKTICKEALQKTFKLPHRPHSPIFGVVSRLAYQKGLDVFASAIDDMLVYDDVQFVVLASGDTGLQNWLLALAARHPAKFAVHVGYSDKLAHLIEAGSDFFVMPSRYEPCGLNQMYSMRYGTPPVVRSTGGLEDTVVNYDPKNYASSTGFKFWDLYPKSLLNTLRWAASVYRHEPDGYRTVQLNGMRQDFSWDHTAGLYERLYDDAAGSV